MNDEAAKPLDVMVLANGYWLSRILFAGQELGVFDCLAAGPKTAEEVRQALGTDGRGTEILLNALTALNLLHKDGGRFSNNPAVENRLVAGRPGSLAHMLAHFRQMWDSWGHLDEAVRSGQPWNIKRRRATPENPAHVRAFIGAMAEMAQASAEELADRLDLSGVERVLDLGGGPGTYAIALAQRKPSLRATILDLPGPLEIARENVARAGLAQQIEMREGNALLDDYGTGYDLVFVSQVLHSYGAEDNARIVRKGAGALAARGWLIINEFVVNEDRASPAAAAVFAVNMLANTEQGRTYTAAEMTQWMAQAGLSNFRQEDLAGRSTLIYGQRLPTKNAER